MIDLLIRFFLVTVLRVKSFLKCHDLIPDLCCMCETTFEHRPKGWKLSEEEKNSIDSTAEQRSNSEAASSTASRRESWQVGARLSGKRLVLGFIFCVSYLDTLRPSERGIATRSAVLS